MYGIMTEELVIHEIRINIAAGWGNSDSLMTGCEVIMPPKLQSTPIVRMRYTVSLVIRENEWCV